MSLVANIEELNQAVGNVSNNIEVQEINNIPTITIENITAPSTFEYILKLDDKIELANYCQYLREKAREFKRVKDVENLISAYKKQAEENALKLKIEKKLQRTQHNGELPYYIMENISEKGEVTYSICLQYLADYIRQNEKYILVINDDGRGEPEFYQYKDGVYSYKDIKAVKGIIKENYIVQYKYLNSRLYTDNMVTAVYNDLMTDLFPRVKRSELNANENIINFQNGLLDLKTMILKPHTSFTYSTIQIPCNYNPNNNNAPVFTNYINTLTNNNQNIKRVLLEFMGVAISNIYGYRAKKALFTIGKGDTGKSQIRKLSNMLVGKSNTSSIDLDSLEERFGTSTIYQKRLIGSADMGFMTLKQLRVFKLITGGDQLNGEFKCGNAFEFTFNGVAWFSANEMPKFGGDRGKWVYDRMIIVECNNVIPKEKQDNEIVNKMFAEREAIINILLSYLKDVISNNYKFHVPDECIKARENYQKSNSIVQLFLDECTEERKNNDSCTTKKMYDIFKEWCKDNSPSYTPSNQDFRKELIGIFKVDNIKDIQKCVHGTYYYNFTLNQSTKKNYTKTYGYDNIEN